MIGTIEALTARPAVVGTGTVLRYLPCQARRLIGAWCFLDVFSGEGSIGVGPHPHLGIQTATWLLEGRTVHRDSIGSLADIGPGELSLMTAGSGIAHAEEPPPGVRDAIGAQLWIALPDLDRWMAPSYAAYDPPTPVDLEGSTALVFIGSFAGRTSQAPSRTALVGAQLDLAPGARTTLELDTSFEHGLVALSGAARVEGAAVVSVGRGTFLPAARATLRIESERGAALLLLGGEPFSEQIVMWWNLVARSESEIVAARSDWEAGRRFGDVRGSALERIPPPPLPSGRLRPRGAAPSADA